MIKMSTIVESERWEEFLSTFQYEVFLEVVETGSFTKAGEKLGLTQSGVKWRMQL